MNNEKLREIIAHQNEQAEHRAADRAHEIIREISSLQQAKKDAHAEIEKLRSELKTLEAPKLDETSILGG